MSKLVRSGDILYWELEDWIGGLLCIRLAPFCNMLVVYGYIISAMHYNNEPCGFQIFNIHLPLDYFIIIDMV